VKGVATDRGPARLTAREFQELSRLAYDYAGLDLRSGKEQLVMTRLGKKLRELNLASFQEYCRHVAEDRTGEALVAMIDALTTNHTSFFREPAHFDFLRRTILPWLRQRERIGVWSAACSTGEEPYSIAISLLEEMGPEARRKAHILATDISTRALAKARRGIYPAERFEGLAMHQLRSHLLRGEERWRGWYQVRKDVRALIEFRRVNLMESIALLGPFPVIFCRNVMIYFDRPTQQDLVRRLAERLEVGGYLLVGHAESLNGLDHPLQYVRPAVYRKPAMSDGGATTRRGRK